MPTTLLTPPPCQIFGRCGAKGLGRFKKLQFLLMFSTNVFMLGGSEKTHICADVICTMFIHGYMEVSTRHFPINYLVLPLKRHINFFNHMIQNGTFEVFLWMKMTLIRSTFVNIVSLNNFRILVYWKNTLKKR